MINAAGLSGTHSGNHPAMALHQGPVRIVSVDDDDLFSRMLADELAEHNFQVTSFSDARSLLQSLPEVAGADLALLDWSLPQTTGIDLLSQMRKGGLTMPVVFLTGRPLTAHENLAFERGAVDFVDKSRGMSILVQRLQLVVRTKVPDAQRNKLVEHGALTLRPNANRASWRGIDVGLTVIEYKVVQLLVDNMGRHVTYREIYDAMHYRGFIGGCGEDGYRTNVRSAIKRIRCKFRELDPEFGEIENFAAFGYVWGKGSVISWEAAGIVPARC